MFTRKRKWKFSVPLIIDNDIIEMKSSTKFLNSKLTWNEHITNQFFIEKLRQLTHVVGNLYHKGIARRALPASGGKDAVGGNRKVNKR